MSRWEVGGLVLWPIAVVLLSVALIRSPELVALGFVSAFLKVCSTLAILLIFLLTLALIAVVGLLLARAGIAAFDALGNRLTVLDAQLDAIRGTLLRLGKKSIPQVFTLLSSFFAFLLSESVGADLPMKVATTLFVAVVYAAASIFLGSPNCKEKAMGGFLWVLPILMFGVAIAVQDANTPMRQLVDAPTGRDLALLFLAGISLIAFVLLSWGQNSSAE